MFLKTALIENVGPIERLELELPFQGDRPLPVVPVGPNGSGKTTLLSFIVNALVAFKQQVHKNAEVESGRVFRLRSPFALRNAASHYHVKLTFDGEHSMEEWFLDRPRERFEKEAIPLPASDGWKQMLAQQHSHFDMIPKGSSALTGWVPNVALSKAFSEHVVLFFPSDRFEPPDWLNQEDLTTKLGFPVPATMDGETPRRIFAKSLLRPTLEWIRAVAFGHILGERTEISVNVSNKVVQAFRLTDGPNGRLISACAELLAIALGETDTATHQFQFQGHKASHISIVVGDGLRRRIIPNLLSLSAGESALFCLFANILRDADLSGMQFGELNAIQGIVVIDEVDLHLHVGMQNDALPALIAKFPNVQFIITTHSPLFVMGIAKRFGPEGYQLLDMPTGRAISPEAFSEFVTAFGAFTTTRAFEERILAEVRGSEKPVVLVEGKTDAAHLRTAWSKLFPGEELPYIIVPCGGEEANNNGGGAKTLKAMLEAFGWYERRPLIGVFDNDQTGAEQHNALRNKDYILGSRPEVLVHSNKSLRAIILPVPFGREAFVPSKIAHRVLELEHYYSDAVLQQHNVAGGPIYAGAPVFEIKNSTKVKFAEAVSTLPVTEFEAFRILFTLLEQEFAQTLNSLAIAPPIGESGG